MITDDVVGGCVTDGSSSPRSLGLPPPLIEVDVVSQFLDSPIEITLLIRCLRLNFQSVPSEDALLILIIRSSSCSLNVPLP